MNIPPPPRGLPRRARATYVVVAAAISAILTLAAPMCPSRDAAGRPLWRVQTVHDGDTVTCLDERGHPVKIRLLGIDAPEHGQPYGDAARAALAAKIGGAVRVGGAARDQHGRLLGVLWAGDTNVNRALVADGLAWCFGGFSPDEEIAAAEAEARRARRGLWADPRPVAPAEWRRLHPPHARPSSGLRNQMPMGIATGHGGPAAPGNRITPEVPTRAECGRRCSWTTRLGRTAA